MNLKNVQKMMSFRYSEEMSNGSKQLDLLQNVCILQQTEDDLTRHKKNPSEIRYFLDKSSFKANPQRSDRQIDKIDYNCL